MIYLNTQGELESPGIFESKGQLVHGRILQAREKSAWRTCSAHAEEPIALSRVLQQSGILLKSYGRDAWMHSVWPELSDAKNDWNARSSCNA